MECCLLFFLPGNQLDLSSLILLQLMQIIFVYSIRRNHCVLAIMHHFSCKVSLIRMSWQLYFETMIINSFFHNAWDTILSLFLLSAYVKIMWISLSFTYKYKIKISIWYMYDCQWDSNPSNNEKKNKCWKKNGGQIYSFW